MDMLGFILNTIASFVLANWLMRVLLRGRDWPTAETQQLIELRRDLRSGNLVALEMEQVGQEILCYDAIKGDFVCQGRSIPEILDRFRTRYPDRRVTCARGPQALIQEFEQHTQS
jgi:hypothetical protein